MPKDKISQPPKVDKYRVGTKQPSLESYSIVDIYSPELSPLLLIPKIYNFLKRKKPK